MGKKTDPVMVAVQGAPEVLKLNALNPFEAATSQPLIKCGCMCDRSFASAGAHQSLPGPVRSTVSPFEVSKTHLGTHWDCLHFGMLVYESPISSLLHCILRCSSLQASSFKLQVRSCATSAVLGFSTGTLSLVSEPNRFDDLTPGRDRLIDHVGDLSKQVERGYRVQ